MKVILTLIFFGVFGNVCGFLTSGNTGVDPQQSPYDDILALIMEEKTLRHHLEWDLGQLKQQHQALQDDYQNKTDGLLHTIQSLQHEKSALVQESNAMNQSINVLKTTINNYTATTDTLMRAKSALEQDVIKMKLESTNHTAAIDSLQREKSAVKQSITSLTNTVNSLTSELTVLKANYTKVTDSTMVMYSGRLGSSGSVTSGTPLRFTAEVHSVGGGYNTTDGIFYCPIAGWYLVDVTITGSSVTSADAYLKKNNSTVGYIWSGATPSSAYPSGSRSTVVRLNVGDKLFVQSRGNAYYVDSYLSIILISKT